MNRYSAVVSIGGNCEVAHQIRRRFGVERAYPFDWWITPLLAVAQLFRTGPDLLFQEENMDAGPARHAVKCRATGTLHHHDFERDSEGLVLATKIPAQLDELRHKYQAVWTRLDEICSGKGRVLFVRGWCDILHYPDGAPKYATRADFEFGQVLTAIQARYPALGFTVLFANYGENRISDERACFVDIDYPPFCDWRGSDNGWDDAFHDVELTRS